MEERLFEEFITAFPSSIHDCSIERFIRYTIEAINNGNSLNDDEEKKDRLRKLFQSEDEVKLLIQRFEWTKTVLKVLNN